MNAFARWVKVTAVLFLAGALSACATAPAGPYYNVRENPTPSSPVPHEAGIVLGPNDQYYNLHISNNTPFGVNGLPKTRRALYDWGYDEVRRRTQADFSIDVALSAGAQENPDVRAGHALGGALFGAAAGAIIGGATGNPGTGAAIGAASGGALGLVAPASTPLVRIDINIYSQNERSSSQLSRTIDLASVPPPDVHFVIDNEVSRMLETLPRR